MTAEVVHLPVPERSCVDCIHYRSSERTTECVLFDVQILSERIAARDCEGYETEEHL